MAILSDRDAASWNELGGCAVAVVEASLDPRVLGNRASSWGARWAMLPLPPALRRARRLGTALARRSDAVLITDVGSFYPSVTPTTLHGALLRIGAEPVHARRAGDMLEGWGSEGYPGLPIGPSTSAVLANAVLHRVDVALGELPFARWVDDYLVGVRSGREAEQALERIDEALAPLGLSRSERKTELVSGGAAVRWLGRSPTGDPTG